MLASPARVANHPPRHTGRESGVPDASEPGSRCQSITPPPQARGGSNETSRCHHGQKALPLRAAMRPDPLPSVANQKTPPQARGGSNGTSRCRHSQRAPLSAPNRDLTPDGPSRQSHKPRRGGGGWGWGWGNIQLSFVVVHKAPFPRRTPRNRDLTRDGPSAAKHDQTRLRASRYSFARSIPTFIPGETCSNAACMIESNCSPEKRPRSPARRYRFLGSLMSSP